VGRPSNRSRDSRLIQKDERPKFRRVEWSPQGGEQQAVTLEGMPIFMRDHEAEWNRGATKLKNEETDATRLLNDTYQVLDEHGIREFCSGHFFEENAVRNAETGTDAFKTQQNVFLLLQS
jgi:hypothetical protein